MAGDFNTKLSRRSSFRIVVLFLLCIGLLCSSGPFNTEAGGAKEQKRSLKLKTSGVEPKGKCRVITSYKEVKGDKPAQYLRLEIKGLVPYGEYTLIVDDKQLLTFRTAPGSAAAVGGNVIQHFDSKFALDEAPCLDGRPLPLEFRPVNGLKKFEIYDSAARLVLSGEF